MSCFSSADESAHYGFSVCMLLEQYREVLRWEEDEVLELGTGDATAISDVVSALPALRVRSFDISASSVASARANIDSRGVADRYSVELGDFFDQADSAGGPPVSTVISNPPYIPLGATVRDPEVAAYDPPVALWAGADGLDVVRVVERVAARLLRPGGHVVVEHADEQGASAPLWFPEAHGWDDVRGHRDLASRPRFVTATKARPLTT